MAIYGRTGVAPRPESRPQDNCLGGGIFLFAQKLTGSGGGDERDMERQRMAGASCITDRHRHRELRGMGVFDRLELDRARHDRIGACSRGALYRQARCDTIDELLVGQRHRPGQPAQFDDHA